MSGLEQSTRMAWARSLQTDSIVHIGTLNKAQKGLQCGCVCPSCGGTLQAVNVDKDASHFAKPNTRGQFFRHASGQQTSSCAVIAARMAALHLLFTQDSIVLPAPKRRIVVRGASGQEYVGLALGESLQAQVRSRIWIDKDTARLTLANGRVVQIQLSGVTEVNSEGVHGIIAISTDDPEVSSWTPEQILKSATLDGDASCWIRHWDDKAMFDTARQDAEEQAADNSDLIPMELMHLLGQAKSLISESVLHWAVKEILAQARSIETPSHFEEINSTYPGRIRVQSKALHWAAENLELSNARLEQRVGSVVPDILCQARDSSRNSFELFVEVVVTHPVSEQKLAKIREIGSACLEIDLRKLRISGVVKREKLRQYVLHETDLKAWLYHPLIDARRQVALRSLNVEVQRQEKLFQDSIAREDTLRSMSNAHLLREFSLALRNHWSGLHPRAEAWTMEELIIALTSQGFPGLDHETVISENGLLWHLETIRLNKPSQGKITGKNPADLFSTAVRNSSIRPYITLLVMAIQKYHPTLTPEERKFITRSFAEIRSSIERGESTYARPRTFDALVSAMYPEIADDIARPFGTTGYVEQLRRDLAEKQRKGEREKRELFAQQKLTEREEALRLATEKAEHDYRAAFDALSSQVWNQDRGMTRYPEQVQKNVRYFGTREKRTFLFDRLVLAKSAWNARERGQPFSAWLASQEPRTAGNIQDCVEILVVAGLVL